MNIDDLRFIFHFCVVLLEQLQIKNNENVGIIIILTVSVGNSKIFPHHLQSLCRKKEKSQSGLLIIQKAKKKMNVLVTTQELRIVLASKCETANY